MRNVTTRIARFVLGSGTRARVQRLARQAAPGELRYQIPEYLSHCSSAWARTLVDMYGQKFAFPACVAPSQGDLLRTLVANIGPRNVVEIGCFIGVSTVWMASALELLGGSGRIHSVDRFAPIGPWPPYHQEHLADPLDFARRAVASAGLTHRVQFHPGDSREIGTHIGKLVNGPIDFLYIDGDHTVEGCLADFQLYSPHVAPGGYIMLHDIYPDKCGWDGPRHLIDHVLRNDRGFEVTEIKTSPTAFGMALIRKVGGAS